MPVMAILVGVLSFAAPATAFWVLVRRLRPRPGSLVGRASKLALHRFAAVMVVLAAHVPLLVLMAVQPADLGPPPPGHQYGPAYETWLREMSGAAVFATLASAASWLAIVVVFFREVILVVRTARAQRRVARNAEPGSPPESTPVDFDFGVGEPYWAFRGPGGDGYREARSIEGWARGAPTLWPAAIGPVISIVTGLAVFGFIGMDMLLSLGD